MCSIMDDLHVYVPSTTNVVDTEDEQMNQSTKLHPISFAGDQLTVARARGAQKLKSDEYTSVNRLEGLFPFSQDWHTFLLALK